MDHEEILEFILNKDSDKEMTFEQAFEAAQHVQKHLKGVDAFVPIELYLTPDGTWVFRILKLYVA